MKKFFKLVVFVPVREADKLREVMSEAGAGEIGNYSHASFSTRGIGRFKPLRGAKPAIGEIGKVEEVEEERIEVVVEEEKLRKVVREIKLNHPYEEHAIDIYPILNPKDI